MTPDDVPDRDLDDAVDPMDASSLTNRLRSRSGRPGSPLGRRDLLATLSAASVSGLAGCSTVRDFLGGQGVPTEYGFGGTPIGSSTERPRTGTATASSTTAASGTDTATPTDAPTDGQTDAPTDTPTDTPTNTPTGTPTPERDYGLQGYGQYGYGGTR